MERMKIGVIGCGNISDIYLRQLTASSDVEVAALADLLPEKARAQAEKYGVARVCSVDDLLADPEIRIVVNLTIPAAHAGVALSALDAGKCVYSEKPLAVTREDGRAVIEKAAAKGLLVGCAPDTFLGAGMQTARRAIDEGMIGEPVAANAFMMSHGMETWHPNPGFYYQPGGGPMLDMGPYYLTALVSLLGPIKRVGGSSRISFPSREITSRPRAGEVIQVNTPTHISGVLDFVCGAIATVTMTFDVWASDLPWIEIHGTRGSLSLPDPNCFHGPVRRRRAGDENWTEIPNLHDFSDDSRGLGVIDMARVLYRGTTLDMSAPPLHRANGQMALHVLDAMLAFNESSEKGRHIELESTCTRPKAMPKIK